MKVSKKIIPLEFHRVFQLSHGMKKGDEGMKENYFP
jgi:hypothetical protein